MSRGQCKPPAVVCVMPRVLLYWMTEILSRWLLTQANVAGIIKVKKALHRQTVSAPRYYKGLTAIVFSGHRAVISFVQELPEQSVTP